MSEEQALAFLREPRTGVLSTLGRGGYPHLSGMWFALAESTRSLRLWTYGKSQKAVNLRRDPRCSFLVEDGAAYSELRGVSVTADAALVTDTDEVYEIGKALYELYSLPATGVPVDQGPEIELRRQAAKRVGIVIPLDNVASWDHSKL